MAELYLFTQGTENTGFSNSLFSKTLGNHLYEATTITRSSLKLSNKAAKNTVDITFTKNNVYAQDLLNYLPEKPITLTIFKDGLSYWAGTVVHVTATDKSIKVTCDSMLSSLSKQGLRATISPTCRHILYTDQCKVSQPLYKNIYVGVVASSTTITMTTGKPPGYFAGGLAEMEGQSRHILASNPSSIQLSQPFKGVLSGDLHLYSGCNLTEADCVTKFNNLDNFGGFARIPTKEPFGRTGLL